MLRANKAMAGYSDQIAHGKEVEKNPKIDQFNQDIRVNFRPIKQWPISSFSELEGAFFVLCTNSKEESAFRQFVKKRASDLV